MNSTTTITRFARISAAGLACLAGTLGATAGVNTFTVGEADTRQTIIVTNDDGQRIRVEVVGDAEPKVELDGKPLNKNRFTFDRDSGKLTIVGRDGETLHALTIAGPGTAQAQRANRFEWATTVGQAPTVWGDRDEYAALAEIAERPPVMIGIYRSDPSPVLAAQLGIEDTDAFVIDKVIPGLGADRAGIEPFDVVVRVDGGPASSLGKVLSKKKPGSELELLVIRRGDKKEFVVELDAYDDAQLMILGDEQAAQQLQGIPIAPTPPSPPGGMRSFPGRLPGLNTFSSDANDAAREALREALGKIDGQLSGQEMEHVRRSLESALAQLQERTASFQNNQALRFDNGRLFVNPGVQSGLGNAAEELEERFLELEARFDELEDRWASLADRLEERMMRMMDRMERRRGSDE